TGKVTALAAAPGGELYAGTEARGVFRLVGGRVVERFTFAGTAGGLRSDTVNAVFVDREGVVWFGTPRGVCRYDPRGVGVEQLSAEAEGNFVRSLYRTSRGRLLAGTSRGLFARDDASGAWREGEEIRGKTVHALAEDGPGLLLVGTSAGLYVGLQAEGRAPQRPVKRATEEKAVGEGGRGKGAGEEVLSKGGTAATGRDEAAANDETGGATAGGEKEGGGEKFKESGGGGKKNDKKVAVEKSSNEGGASEPLSKKTAEPALSGSVRAIARFGQSVYVATFGRGLERFDGPGRRTLVWPRAGHDERGREVVSLYADAGRGRLWVGTANAGVFYFDGREVKREPSLAPLEGSTVWGAS